MPLVSAYRYDGPEVNTSLAHSEAKILHEKINDGAYGDDEIIRILTTRSKAQLLATFNSYNDQFSHPITKVKNNYSPPLTYSSFFQSNYMIAVEHSPCTYSLEPKRLYFGKRVIVCTSHFDEKLFLITLFGPH